MRACMHANVQGLRGREKVNPIMSDVGVTGAAEAPVACVLSQCMYIGSIKDLNQFGPCEICFQILDEMVVHTSSWFSRPVRSQKLTVESRRLCYISVIHFAHNEDIDISI